MSAMARSHVARQRPRLAPAGRSAGRRARQGRLLRVCTATGIAGLAAALPLLSGPAEAQPIAQPPRNPLEMTVTSVSPSYAQQGQTVTITGQVRNLAAAAATGLSVQLMSSHTALGTRLDLENFAHGSYLPTEGPVSV